MNLDLNIYDFFLKKAFLKWFVSIYNIIYFSNVSLEWRLFFFFFPLPNSRFYRIIIFQGFHFNCFVTSSLFYVLWKHCAVIRPLNAFSNWRVRTVKKRCWRIRQRKWGSSRGERFKRTVKCQFPSVQNYCFFARTKSQHIFLICSALNWKNCFFLLVAELSWDLADRSSEVRWWTSTRRLWITCSHTMSQVRQAGIRYPYRLFYSYSLPHIQADEGIL